MADEFVAVSFSGPSKRLSSDERNLVSRTVATLDHARTFISGGAQGVDCIAAAYALRAFPRAAHMVVVPRYQDPEDGIVPCAYYVPGVAALQRLARAQGTRFSVLDGPVGGTPPQGYLRRDDVLAQLCTDLVAFPRTPTEQQRSGTWATIRRARSRKRAVHLFPLDSA